MNKIKMFSILGAIGVVLGLGIWAGFKIKEVADTNNKLNEELMKANLEIGKAHTQFGDANKKIDELNATLQAEIKAHKEKIRSYNELLAKYNVQGGSNGNVNPVGPPQMITDKLIAGSIYLALTEAKLRSYGDNIAWSHKDTRLDIECRLKSVNGEELVLNRSTDYKLHLNLKVKMAETIAPSGAVNNYAEIYEIDENGKEMGKFEITKFESVVTDQRKSHFMLFDPKLDIGVFSGFDGAFKYGGTVGISIAAYGLTPNDLTWRFARFGVELFSNGVGFDFEPVLWNLGGPLPLIQNLWIGPSLTFDLNERRFGFGGVLSVTL